MLVATWGIGFSCNNVMYSQIEDVVIGSLLYLFTIVLSIWEKELCVGDEQEAVRFFGKFDSLHPSLKFSME